MSDAPTTASAAGPQASGSGHLASLDVVRVLTLVGVVAVHSVSITITAASLTGGAFLSVAHITRSVFLGLSGFVLAYRAGDERIRPVAFWRRRYVLVVIPYLVWTAIYVAADGAWGTPLHVIGRFFADVGDGGARYHLYFLLLTFQLYAVYPWLLAAVRRCNPRWLLALSVAFQLAFTAGTHWWTNAPGILGLILSHPGSWLWSYEGYVVVGVLAALHLDALTAWVTRYRRLIALATAATAVAALGWFFVQVDVFSMNTTRASEVFQPSVTLFALVAMVGLFALGTYSVGRVGTRVPKALRQMSDTSFGVYLSHPLILQGILALAGVIGIRSALSSTPVVVQLLLVLFVLVPLAYGCATFAVALVRRTPVSLAFCGRRPLRRTVNRPLSPPTAKGAPHGLDLSGPAASFAQTTR